VVAVSFLRHIAPERLIISSVCGMCREGMSRILVDGTSLAQLCALEDLS